MKKFFLGFALASLILAGAVSYLASSNPDGLDYVTKEQGIAAQTQGHPLAGGPLANYAVGGDSRFTGVAGIVGVLATLLLAGGLFWLLRKRSRQG